jgi:hypothetical protein
MGMCSLSRISSRRVSIISQAIVRQHPLMLAEKQERKLLHLNVLTLLYRALSLILNLHMVVLEERAGYIPEIWDSGYPMC